MIHHLCSFVSLYPSLFFFFFYDTATTEIYTLSLHDALPILARLRQRRHDGPPVGGGHGQGGPPPTGRSEEHTSELQSLRHLVCRLLLEKKKTRKPNMTKQEKKRTNDRVMKTYTSKETQHI